ncbi:histidine kinase [Sorangium cellulosum]|uniref:Histidine kinase n=1 Tax=Sorangium cellulosum TaxID=56 RepID=A0A4P2Q0R7_SORCE|nr:AAA family ATPase [Sorangium cellulosum]AUX22496.1 histidine kinase [Sorangium cellulosum]
MSSTPGYTLTRLIHESATSTVYRGYRNEDGAPVAVKRLKGDRPDPAEIAKLRYEHAIARELSLPGVVRVLALEKIGANLALVMEDAGGCPLHELIGSSALDLQAALRVARSLARTLDSIHQRGVIHMDIKPQNVIVDTSTWEAKIMDFGSATRLAQEEQRSRSPAGFEGTLAYMSPEQTGRVNRVIDARTDLYSLGITLYEMLTGRLPFQTQDLMELVHCHVARLPVPPRQLSPEIPGVVSEIVMKLLAKSPDDRYQGAYGLEADLAECLDRLQATSTIEPFPLGRRDHVDVLRVPQKLHGREAELAILDGAWRRACQGASEVVLVSGHAGIGKTLLVGELHRAIAQGKGYLVAGRFDRIDRTTPYRAVAHVFRELIRAFLAEPTEALAAWKERLGAAVGLNGRLVADLIPELELILGPQPGVAPLGPTEAQRRFYLTFQRFLAAIPTRERPLVVFLDDLQWADPASLKLLEQLLTGSGVGHLLFVGAYRDSEVDGGHLLSLTLAELRKAGVAAREIRLEPLELPVVIRLVADTLSCDPGRAEPLARHVMSKTHGNPFFVGQFLKALHGEKLIALDRAAGAWTWDLPRIQEMNVTDNVVDFMAGKLRELGEGARRILSLAACIGHRFDLKTLSELHGAPCHEAARELSEALREGLVVAVDAESRFFDVAVDDEANGRPSGPAPAFDVSYRFLHDRVRQAAYLLLDDARKQAVHLRIGRLLLAGRGPGGPEGEVFEVATHLNLGAPLITDEEERRALARLNREAGKRARAGAAYETAAGYFEAGMAALGPGSWDEDYELSLALCTGLAECRCLTGQFRAGDRLFDVALEHARTRLERAQIHGARMSFHLTLGQLAEVVQCGLRALSLLGVDIPEAAGERGAQLERELGELRAYLSDHEATELLALPVVADPEGQLVLQLLADLTLPATSLRIPALGALALIKQLNLARARGTSSASAYACVMYAIFRIDGVFPHGTTQERYREAYAFARVGIALNERIPDARITCQLLTSFAAILHFFEPLRDTIKLLTRARQAGLEAGDLAYASYCCIHMISASLGLGDDLGAVAEEIEQGLALMRRTNDRLTTHVLTCARQVVANLTGRTAGAHTLSDDAFDEAAFVGAVSAPELVFVSAWYHLQKVELAFLYGDHGAARSHLDAVEQLPAGAANNFWATERALYASLVLAASYEEAEGGGRERILSAIAAHQAQLAHWAELCPANYAHKHLLVAAEVARVTGDERGAMALYDRAIDGAQASGFTRDEAMASELAARLYLAGGRVRCARAYMTDAVHAYLRWGATAKADRLTSEAPHLVARAELLRIPPGRALELPRASIQTTSTTRLSTGVLDVEAVLRAAEAIAGEVILDSVVQKLVDIAIQNAGAKKGVLILEREQRLVIEASITEDPRVVRVGQSIPVERGDEVPLSIVQYVARTREPVVLADGKREARFAADPYVAARDPRSILCLPMVHQGNVTGILYLENSASRDVFTPARLELSKLLLAQAATAVQNAVLYAHLHRRTEALRGAEERLRVEFAERERSEQARVALQEEIIRVQNARLAELSTPIIPITDRIMVMPLIGMMDAQRAQQVLSTALHGVESSRADVVIIDITGVRTVDSDVASTLINTAMALRLLGAQAVITGIRPDVAQTLTGLQIDFGAVVTRGNLQSGIAYALQRTGSPGALLGARPG